MINLLTPSGKLNLIVRGAKKINSKTRAFAIPLTLLQFEHTNNRELNTLTKCEVLDYYSSIKENPKLMFVAYAILEKINLIPMADQDDKLFYQFVVDTLNLLKNTQYPDSLLAIFELKLLYLLGVNPRFNQCPICNKPVKDGCFSVEAAGVVCRDDCWNILTDLSFNHTKMMKYLYTIKLDKVDENFWFGQSVHSGNRRSNRPLLSALFGFYQPSQTDRSKNVRRTKKQNVIRPFSGALHGLFYLGFPGLTNSESF